MEQLKARKEMDPAYTWDFTDLYPSDEGLGTGSIRSEGGNPGPRRPQGDDDLGG